MNLIKKTENLSHFVCLGDKCEDTCCQKWSMQLDEATHSLYKREAPELLSAVEAAEEAPWIMRKDPASGFCVKLEGGLCGIHAKYGDSFLGDACYFYPRVTRTLGSETLMTATMSCPEIARLALFENKITVLEPANMPRLPSTLRNYLPDGMDTEDAMQVHQAFLDATKDSTASAEQIYLRIASASRSLERIDTPSWKMMAPFYLQHADMRLQPAQHHIADAYNLLHALSGLIVASRRPPTPRLMQTIVEMETALAAKLTWGDNVLISIDELNLPNFERAKQLWKEEGAAFYAQILRNWLQMQLSLALYPYSGLGATLSERITIIGVRLATIKLALLSNYNIARTSVSQDVVVRIVQGLSRFLDHLGDPALSLSIYTETGWVKEERMRGLLHFEA